jgi:hypothetical protein
MWDVTRECIGDVEDTIERKLEPGGYLNDVEVFGAVSSTVLMPNLHQCSMLHLVADEEQEDRSGC